MTKADPLGTWIDLNAALADCDIKFAEELLKKEQSGKKRKQFVLRIHSRINRLRRVDERTDLLKKLGK